MKDLNKPDAPKKPKTGWRKKWDEMSPEKKDQVKTKAIGGILVAIIAVFLIRQFLPSAPATPQQPDQPDQTQETQAPEPGQITEQTDEDIFNRANIQPDKNPDQQGQNDNYEDTGGTSYYIVEPGEEHNRIAHMYVPASYKANPVTGGVQILMADKDPAVTGTEPLLFHWTRQGWYHYVFDNGYYDMIADGGATGFKKYDYTLVDKYMTCDLNGNPCAVYIVHLDKLSEDEEYAEFQDYTAEYIILDKPNEADRYFVGTADNYAVQELFTQRYPDIQSLARAIYPEYNGHPDAGGKTLPEPEQAEPTVDDGEETPPPDAVIDDPTVPEATE